MELLLLAKYPFLKAAREMVSGTALDGLGYESVESAKRRATASLKDGKIEASAPKNAEDAKATIISYAVARVLITALKNRLALYRYAVAEAKRASAYMRSEDDKILSVISSELGLPFTKGELYYVNFIDYLKALPEIRDYSLANVPLRNGVIELKKEELARVLEEAVRRNIEQGLVSAQRKLGALPKRLADAAAELAKYIPKESFEGKFFSTEEEFPPCIKRLLGMLRTGENLSHNARWLLAVFLLNSGMKPEDVVKTFASAPDFSEAKTRYQVDYLKKKGYRMPSCTTLESYGLCIERCGARNPIRYKNRKVS